MALGLMAGCRDVGLTTPQDISIVGMDDGFFASLVHPALTTVKFPLADIARQAVDRVIELQHGQAAGQEVIFEPSLVLRDSVGTAP